jgi:hypothetical protein
LRTSRTTSSSSRAQRGLDLGGALHDLCGARGHRHRQHLHQAALEALGQRTGEVGGGLLRAADDQAVDLELVEQLRQLAGHHLDVGGDALVVVPFHPRLRAQAIGRRRVGAGRHERDEVAVLLDLAKEDGEQAGALLVDQDDAEPLVLVERLEQRAQERAVAPVGPRRQRGAHDVAECHADPAMAREHQRLAGRLDAFDDLLDLGRGRCELVVVGPARAQLAQEVFEAGLELPLAVDRVGLVDVEVHGQGLSRRLRKLLQLLDVTVADHVDLRVEKPPTQYMCRSRRRAMQG